MVQIGWIVFTLFATRGLTFSSEQTIVMVCMVCADFYFVYWMDMERTKLISVKLNSIPSMECKNVINVIFAVSITKVILLQKLINYYKIKNVFYFVIKIMSPSTKWNTRLIWSIKINSVNKIRSYFTFVLVIKFGW